MVVLHHILCPVDFSEASRHAFDLALVLARQEAALLTVLHMMPAPVLVGGHAPGPQGAAPEGADAEEQRREELRRFVRQARPDDARLQLRVEYGDGADEILRQAACNRADIIVTNSPLRQAAFPLLVVPPHCRGVPPAGFGRIVCGIGFSPSSVSALRYAMALAANSPSARLALVHVLEGFPHEEVVAGQAGTDLGLYWRFREGLARTSLGELAGAHAGACQTEAIVSSGQPWRELLDLAAEREADLIVVGAHGRRASAAPFGSTTERLMGEAASPVLVVPD